MTRTGTRIRTSARTSNMGNRVNKLEIFTKPNNPLPSTMLWIFNSGGGYVFSVIAFSYKSFVTPKENKNISNWSDTVQGIIATKIPMREKQYSSWKNQHRKLLSSFWLFSRIRYISWGWCKVVWRKIF